MHEFARLGRQALWALVVAMTSMNVMAREPLEFNVATYNLRLNTPEDGLNAWPLRKEAVKELIRYHQIDLLGTQEGYAEQLEDLTGSTGYAYVGVGRDDGQRAGEHSAILYRSERFAVLAHGDFWLSPTPEVPGKGWDAKCCNRISSWAHLRERRSGQEFYAFAVHFDHEGVIARRESAHLMLRKIREIAGEHPVLCLGDFNATPDAEPISIMAAGMRDARQESLTPPYGPVGTFNDFRIDAPLKDRIDYIFLGPRWKVLRYAVLTDSVAGRFPSDHLPVVARVALD